MIIDTNEAAKKLGTTNGVIRMLTVRGVLTDHSAGRQQGKSKHYIKLDSREVNMLAKFWQKRTSAEELKRRMKEMQEQSEMKRANGRHTTPASPAAPVLNEVPFAAFTKAAPPVEGILTVLRRIEEKIDNLVKLWA